MSDLDYYFALGFAYGDGHIANSKAIALDLKITDWYFLQSVFVDRFGGHVSFGKKFDKRTKKFYYRARSYIKCAHLSSDLKSLRNISYLPSLNSLTMWPSVYTAAFLAGLINADGSLYRSGDSFRFYLCLEPNISDAVSGWFFEALDIQTFTRERPKLKDVVVYRKGDIQKIYDLLIRPHPKIKRKWFTYESYRRPQAFGQL